MEASLLDSLLAQPNRGTIPQLQVGLHPGQCQQEPLCTISHGTKENGSLYWIHC